MKTIQHYRAAVSKFTRCQFLIGAAVVLATSVAGVGMAMYSQYVPTLVAFLTPLGILVFGTVLLVWVLRIQQTRLGLRCPHCGGGLDGSDTRQVVIATRNCPTCGKPVLEGD